MVTSDQSAGGHAPTTPSNRVTLQLAYEAAWQYALDEDRRAQFRFYNYVLINTLFLVGFASGEAWPLWPGLGIAVSIYWRRIGDRLLHARLFWMGRLRLIEHELFGDDEVPQLFRARDQFFSGKPVELIDPSHGPTEAAMPEELSTWSTNTTEATRIPFIIIVMWVVVLLLKVVGYLCKM